MLTLIMLMFAMPSHALPSFGDVHRNPDGTFRFVAQENAARDCGTRGGTLPTARDFALFAISKGAEGIRETKYVDVSFRDPEVEAEASRFYQQGFEAVYRFGPEQTWVVDFYYNPRGYRAPAGDLAVLSLWSRSNYPGNPEGVSSYVFGAETGRIDVNFRNIENSFACLP